MCFSLATDWLDKCSREHVECKKQNSPAPLPTRVIDVGDSQTEPHLHVTEEGEVGAWAALSYCWGGESGFILNASSFSRFRRQIPLSDFPLTLRDAILVTRRFGLRYLWIDSLCIFQDDDDDWAIEASRMSSVYSSAAVTIAATSAETVNSGFLDGRERYFNLKFPWRRYGHRDGSKHEHRTYPVVFRGTLRAYMSLDRLTDLRWGTRGWTLQEQLLPARVLFYSPGEMIWQCRTGTAIEPAEEVSDRITLFSQIKRLPFLSDKPEDPMDNTRRIHKAWYNLLEQYTERHLTIEDDRLPAIGALAQTFHTILNEQYCAGLWRGDLLSGLLWSIKRGSRSSALPGTYVQRVWFRILGHKEKKPKTAPALETPTAVTSKNCAPSWSWVGSDFSVGLNWPCQDDDLDYLARVIGVDIHSKSQNHFGRLESAELLLHAPYHHLNLRLRSYSKPWWNPVSLLQRTLTRLGPLAKTKKLAQIALTRPDYLAETNTNRSVIVPDSSTEFTVIKIAKTAHQSNAELLLLILQPEMRHEGDCEEPQRYRRVGLLELRSFWHRGDSYVGEMMTDKLQSGAYAEVAKEEWPVKTFVIV